MLIQILLKLQNSIVRVRSNFQTFVFVPFFGVRSGVCASAQANEVARLRRARALSVIVVCPVTPISSSIIVQHALAHRTID